MDIQLLAEVDICYSSIMPVLTLVSMQAPIYCVLGVKSVGA
jgi:hypothetical protein